MLLKRSLAFTTDLFIVALLQGSAMSLFSLSMSDEMRLLMALAIAAVYFTFFLWQWNGRTPGTRLLGLKVVHPSYKNLPFRAALLRALGVELSYLLLGFGFTLSLIRLDRRTLPDIISGTDVLRSR